MTFVNGKYRSRITIDGDDDSETFGECSDAGACYDRKHAAAANAKAAKPKPPPKKRSGSKKSPRLGANSTSTSTGVTGMFQYPPHVAWGFPLFRGAAAGWGAL